jgi:hypothetical protein
MQDGGWQNVVDSIEEILDRRSDPGREREITTHESISTEHVGDPPQGQRLQVNVAKGLTPGPFLRFRSDFRRLCWHTKTGFCELIT